MLNFDLSLNDPIEITRNRFYLNTENGSSNSILSDVTFVLNDDDDYFFEERSDSDKKERKSSIVTISSSESRDERKTSMDSNASSYNSLENIKWNRTKSKQTIHRNLTKKTKRRKRDDAIIIGNDFQYGKTPTPIMFEELKKRFPD